jgi:hypothetical protein
MNKILLIFSICLSAILIVLLAWWLLKPMQIVYRDSVEMGIGDSKTVIIKVLKLGTIFEFAHIDYGIKVLNGDDTELTPNYLSVIDTGSSSIIGSHNQIDYIEVSSSPEALPGDYHLYVQIKVLGIGMAKLPINVSIKEADDDVVDTPSGPAYRANTNPLGENAWASVQEQTVLLGPEHIHLIYRDTLNVPIGGYKTIILTLKTAGASFMGKDIIYTLGALENGQMIPLPDAIGIKYMRLYTNVNSAASVTVMGLSISSKWQGAEVFNLGLKAEAEGVSEIGIVPLTVNVIESPDDTIFIPAGILVYRAQIQTHGKISPWPPINETAIFTPEINHN